MYNIFKFIYRQNLFTVSLFFIALIVFWAWVTVFRKEKTLKILNACLLFACAVVIAYSTLFTRSQIFRAPDLIPFHFLVVAKVQSEIYRSVFMNVLLFVPMGVFMPFAVAGRRGGRFAVAITVVSAAVFSAAIEFLQYFYHLGLCETDDVIFNTLGAAIGSLSYILHRKIKFNLKRSGGVADISSTQKNLLKLCAAALFGGEFSASSPDYPAILKEAAAQTVLPLAESVIKSEYPQEHNRALQTVAKNILIAREHSEIHKLLYSHNIPYVILKGCASARYYPDPLLRTMGDVDFLVPKSRFEEADRILQKAGFTREGNGGGLHTAYKKLVGNANITYEMHRSVNGIPEGATGDKLRALFTDIFDKAELSSGGYFVPSDFHHGLILLLHTASHLTHEGVGLRHLADWVIFAEQLQSDAFCDIFEHDLKMVGLWDFACALTAVGAEFLGASEKKWARGVDTALTQELLADILNGGNFGTKDFDRYNQIKFISNRDDNTVDKKSPLAQLFCTINYKAKKEYAFSKHTFLVPVAWICVVFDYAFRLVSGKARLGNINKTLSSAANRKTLYHRLNIFVDKS